MSLSPTVVAGLNLLAAVSFALVFLYVLRLDPAPGRTGFLVSMAGGMVWATMSGFDKLIESLVISRWIGALILLGASVNAIGWALFAIEYAVLEEIPDKVYKFVAVYVLASQFVIWTNPLHHLAFAPDSASLLYGSVLMRVEGPWFWVRTIVAIGLIITGILVLSVEALRSHGQRLKQSLLVTAAGVVPLTAAFVYIADVNPVPYDFTTTSFTISAGLILVALTRYDFLQLAPVGKDTVFEEISEAVLIVDDEDRIVDFNSTAACLFSLDKSVGKTTAEVFAPDSPVNAVLHDGGVEQEWTPERGEQDSRFSLSAYDIETESRIQNSGGQVLIARDITDRHRRREELEEQTEGLEKFAGIVSHDLKNHMQVIDGYVEVARETGNLSHLDKVKANIEQMDEFLDELLELSRAGNTISERESLDLCSVAQAAWSNVETHDATVQLTGEIPVDGDRTRLTEALENLFENAIEHGGPNVTVRVAPVDGGFVVADDGPGIPPESRTAVFEYGVSMDEEGTGFGLAIVQEIIEAHGWSITLSASDEGGVRFEVTGVGSDTV